MTHSAVSVAPEPAPITLSQLVTPGLDALRRYWPAFLVLQACALGLVVSYYTAPGVATWCERLAAFKVRGGLLFAAVAASIAGALLPEIAKAVAMGEWTLTRQRSLDFLFALGAFAISGIITDFQYRGLAIVFGDDMSFGTVVAKTLTDQFITTPIYGITYWAFAYALKRNRFNVGRTVREIDGRWYVTNVLPLLLPSWAFWLPMVSLIYALPGPLQFWLFSLALSSWSLIMVFVATRPRTDDRAATISSGEDTPPLPASEPTIVR